MIARTYLQMGVTGSISVFCSNTCSHPITRSELTEKLGFDSTKALKDMAAVLELEPIKYLEELSGWQERSVEKGGRKNWVVSP